MAKKEDRKWENSEEEEEEEEALSLCDLPINLIEEESHHHQLRKEEIQETEEDFDFSQFGSTKSEMCSADDIFFQGQILPFRLSVSSETSTCKSSQDSLKNPRNDSISRSESMDHGFTSFSSRSSSSSSRSQFSSISTTTTSSSVNQPARISISKQQRSKIQNQFHTHPSPKPQIRLSTANNNNRAIRKSTAWDIFRLGLVRTPEIELQDLKNRTSVSRNSSSNSSNSSNANQEKKLGKQRRKHQNLFDKRSTTGGGLLSGCSCTVSAVKPVPLNTPINKTEEKQKIIKRLKKKKKKLTEKQRGKQAMSRHRTFEWIKELSHVSFDDHQS